ncbi:DNA recombination protein RmuC homolog [Sphingomonas aurantiaca]|uniref:DNA recombination protein RmuC homolog n=1 Tax=Sphingomonas aurantiaca TaxID=185949 RepID=A0A5E7ZPQ5_9SPHN|nr:DNA recombination protein RmuC [Sphingomonas aurantiaca]VVT20817.1 DNA recombination protein RmuC homolog [Sphingomonas aurantiaca]
MAEFAVIAVLALAAGVLLGWLLASRRATTLASDLAVARTKAADADLIRTARDAVERERNDAQRDLARLQAQSEERQAAHLVTLRQLKEANDAMTAQFGAAAAKALEAAQVQFLDRADARFRQSEETAGQNLKSMLQPVSDRLQRYEEGVAKVEAERRDAFGDLKGQIEQMRLGQEKVSTEAAKLVNSLRNAPKSRGRWGEQQLKNVLETCGLSEHTDFQTEVSVAVGDDGARLRPDAIIRVPGGRALVIDAKVSLNAYQDAFGAVDDSERLIGLAAHAASMRAHVNGLGNKAYWSQFADTPDYVIMFVPGEHFLSAALEHDPTLWDFAFEKKVLLATPTNLIAIARTVAAVWRQEKLANEARKIGELGKEMHDRLAKVADDLRKVGVGLNSAVKNFNGFTNSFNGRLMVTGRKFRDLNIETGARDLEDVSSVDALALGEGPALIEKPEDAQI